MKAILEKFPKAVLIKFILQDTRFLFKSKDDLEGQLLFYQWDHEEEACAQERTVIQAELKKFEDWDIPGNHYKFMEVMKKSDRNHKRWEHAQKLYEKSQKLSGY